MIHNSLQKKVEILKKHFNNYCLILSSCLENINHSFKIYKSFIEELVNNNSNKLLDTFIISVLKYEEYIMNGDDDFFLGNNYDDYKDNRIKVFEFKSIWTSLSEENKNVIKSYMKILCQIARKYFDLLYEN